MNDEQIEEILKSVGAEEIPAEVHKIAEEASIDFSKTLMQTRQPNRYILWEYILRSPLTKLAAAAVIIIAILIGIHQFGGSIESVAWASVAERFRSAPFFNATLYLKQDATAQPEQIELWMNREGFARLRYDNQVAFAKEGKITKAFDIETRSEIEPDQRVVTLVHLMGDTESFSLETVIRGISGGELVDVTPLVNTDAVISEDLVVFDVESGKSSQWFRIWALRESKLPVRIRMWDPRDGACADVLLTYSKQQQENFFDPEEFSSKMKSLRGKDMNLVYMYLKDPGGKQVFPGSLNESEAFSVVTQTIDGRRWSLADHRGKVVLLTFWSRYVNAPDVHKKIHEEFGGRDDFLMVGVALDPDPGKVKAYCQREGIEWVQLHEQGRPWKNENGMILREPDNSLARAFGVKWAQIWLVWKDGSMNRLDQAFLRDAVEAALLDLMSWPSSQSIAETLYYKGSQGGFMTRKEVEQIFGKAESVGITLQGRESWNYTLFRADHSRIWKCHVDFDKTGKVAGYGSGHSPESWPKLATVSITIGKEYWHEHVRGKIDPEILAKNKEEYEITLYVKSPDRNFALERGVWAQWISEKNLEKQMFVGTYDFYFHFNEKGNPGLVQEILLQKGVEVMDKDKQTIWFE